MAWYKYGLLQRGDSKILNNMRDTWSNSCMAESIDLYLMFLSHCLQEMRYFVDLDGHMIVNLDDHPDRFCS
jgi:hypothetical protein